MRRSACPGRIGSVGCVRSSAWIWLFSSAHSTSARSGGLRYRPTISRTFSINCGSVDSLNVSVRCGCRPKAFQIRCTALARHARRRRHRANAPVRGIPRRGFQRLDHHRLDLVIGDAPRCATARLVQQTPRHLQPRTASATCQRSCSSGAARARPGCWNSPSLHRSTISARTAKPMRRLATRRPALQCRSVLGVNRNSRNGPRRRYARLHHHLQHVCHVNRIFRDRTLDVRPISQFPLESQSAAMR